MQDVLADDPIEIYLDRLLVALSGSPRDVRRALAEAELHLYESAASLEASGLRPRRHRPRRCGGWVPPRSPPVRRA